MHAFYFKGSLFHETRSHTTIIFQGIMQRVELNVGLPILSPIHGQVPCMGPMQK